MRTFQQALNRLPSLGLPAPAKAMKNMDLGQARADAETGVRAGSFTAPDVATGPRQACGNWVVFGQIEGVVMAVMQEGRAEVEALRAMLDQQGSRMSEMRWALERILEAAEGSASLTWSGVADVARRALARGTSARA